MIQVNCAQDIVDLARALDILQRLKSELESTPGSKQTEVDALQENIQNIQNLFNRVLAE